MAERAKLHKDLRARGVAPCPSYVALPWRGTFYRAKNTILHAIANAHEIGTGSSLVVNVGAKWDPWYAREYSANDDPAWSMTFAVDHLNMIAFEADADAYNRTQNALRHSGAGWWHVSRGHTIKFKPSNHTLNPPAYQAALDARVRLLHEKVSPSTICARLDAAGARAFYRFLMLKVDIDSFDAYLTEALLKCGP